MDTSAWINLVSMVCAVLSIIGGALSYWSSKGSKAAKLLAEQARDEAARKVEAAESSAASFKKQVQLLEEQVDLAREAARSAEDALTATREQATAVAKIAESLSPDVLTAEWIGKNLFILRNNSDSAINVVWVENRSAFVRIDIEDKFTIGPHRSIEISVMGAWGHPIPGELVLSVSGQTQPVVVSLASHP